MNELIFRTEELSDDQIENYYVDSELERDIIRKLKAQSPVLLVGSRGVGKSFLFKICELQTKNSFEKERILPVSLTFRKASLIQNGNAQFYNWMIGKIISQIHRTLKQFGFASNISTLMGIRDGEQDHISKVDQIVKELEESYQNPDHTVDDRGIPDLDMFLDSIEDLCRECKIKRVILFIDEAAHVFYAEQQRQFFTLFRDLRSQYIKCNAAVYPGVTVYGDSFEPVHDATVITLVRNISDDHYLEKMKQMVLKQVSDSTSKRILLQYSENFNTLIFASSGNPRILLKSIEQAPTLKTDAINKALKEYYRESLWADHTKLGERYSGYKAFIDWGRDFIETNVLVKIKQKNDDAGSEGATTAYFWIHKDAPREVKEAIRLLEYSGLVYEQAQGIRATRSNIGTRYMVNIGCLLALDSSPAANAKSILSQLDIRRFIEYGENAEPFQTIQGEIVGDETAELKAQLTRNIDDLELTAWQKERLHSININTIGELLSADEMTLMKAERVAEKRARIMKNACVAAVYEYLLG